MDRSNGAGEAGGARSRLPTVYLCGPITGISFEQATSWRRSVIAALAREAEVIDPTREVPDLTRRSENAATQALTTERLLHGKHTVARAQYDIGAPTWSLRASSVRRLYRSERSERFSGPIRWESRC